MNADVNGTPTIYVCVQAVWGRCMRKMLEWHTVDQNCTWLYVQWLFLIILGALMHDGNDGRTLDIHMSSSTVVAVARGVISSSSSTRCPTNKVTSLFGLAYQPGCSRFELMPPKCYCYCLYSWGERTHAKCSRAESAQQSPFRKNYVMGNGCFSDATRESFNGFITRPVLSFNH